MREHADSSILRRRGRPALVAALAAVAVVASLLVGLVASPGATIADEDRFVAATVAAVQSGAGAEQIGERVLEQREEAAGGLILAPETARRIVTSAISSPAAGEGLAEAARQAHGQLIAPTPADTITLDLAAIREAVGREAPRLRAAAAADLDEVEVAAGPAVAAAGGTGWVSSLPGSLAAVLVLMIGALAAAMALARDRARLARALGIGLVGAAAVPLVLALAGGAFASAVGGPIAGELTSRLAGLNAEAIVLLPVAGIGVTLLAWSAAARAAGALRPR